MKQRRFDDIDGLLAAATSDFSPWGPEIVVTQGMINSYAEISGDYQWIHVDRERAINGPFGTTIAHGLLTVSIMAWIRPKLQFEIVGEGSRVNYGCEGYRLMEPVPSGSRVHARMRLLDARKHARGTLTIQEICIHVIGNDRPSLSYKGMLLYVP